MEKLTFTVDSALLSELGEKLVEKVHYALVELVKNSYDADAKKVSIKFVEGDLGIREIQISDDGIGMNFEEIRKYWMHIATTNKLNRNISPTYGRPKTGSKGIGRFCCRRLGKALKLITVGKKTHGIYERTEVDFDWSAFVPGTQVTDIECMGTIKKLKEGLNGTTLIITDLSDEWTQQGYNYLKRQLALLVANRGTRREGYIEDPGFDISIDAPGFEGDIRDLRHDLIDAGWATLKAHINKRHQAVCELDALGIGRKTTISEQKFTQLSDISMKLGIMIMDREQMRDTNVISIGSLREILPEWGGVQVRYRGFRIYPYGDDDWLDIDRGRGLRKTTPKGELFAFAQQLKGIDPSRALLTMSSMDSYIGSVEIGPNAQGFEMKANREGFIDSQAVSELKAFVRFGIDWSTIYHDYFLRQKIKKEAEDSRKLFEESIEEVVEPSKVVESAVRYLEKEFKNISLSLPTKQRQKVDDVFYKATDAILAQSQHNQEELRHLRLIASTSTLLLIFSHEVKALLGLLETGKNRLENLTKKLSDDVAEPIREVGESLTQAKTRFNELLSMTAIIGVDSRKEKPTNIALFERIENAVKVYNLIVTNYDIEVDYKSQVPKNIVVGPILEAELYTILLNLLSNSIKSVIASGKGKKIRIAAKRYEGKTLIRIMDNGLGLDPSMAEKVFTPFVADVDGKLYKNLDARLNPEDKYIVGTGSGLGLSIVNEIVQARNGKVAILPPEDMWRAIVEVTLP